MTTSAENPREARRPTTRLTMKDRTRIETWNVHTPLYETGRATQVANEMRKYNIAVLAMRESRWNGGGQVTLATGEQQVLTPRAERSSS